MSMDTFDTDNFIGHIQSQPAIWNYQSEEYSNKIAKTKAWEYVCQLFHSNFQDLSNSEKHEIVSQLQRKWKSLRDSFTRELNKMKKYKSKGGFSSRKQYMYFNQLLFLKPLAELRASALEEQTTEDTAPECEAVTPPPRTTKRKKPQKQEELILSQVLERGITQVPTYPSTERRIVKEECEEYPEEKDDDRLFLLSLEGDLKKVSDDFKSDAKCEILQVLKKFKKLSTPHPYLENTGNFGIPAYPYLPSGTHFLSAAAQSTLQSASRKNHNTFPSSGSVSSSEED